MDVEEMRAQVAAHDEQVAAATRAAAADLVASEPYKAVREKLAAIAAIAPRAPLDAILGSISTSLDLLEQVAA